MAYIKLEDAINHIKNHTPFSCSADFFDGQMDCIVQLKSLPTADVEEVKHGKWIAHYNGSFKPIYRCSVCNERLIGYSDPNKVPYCHCGAKMDK